MVPQSWRVGSIEPVGRPPAQINDGHVRLSQERQTHRIRLIGELHTYFRSRVEDEPVAPPRPKMRADPGGGCLIGGYPKSAAAAGVSPHRTAPNLPRTLPGTQEKGHPKAAFSTKHGTASVRCSAKPQCALQSAGAWRTKRPHHRQCPKPPPTWATRRAPCRPDGPAH